MGGESGTGFCEKTLKNIIYQLEELNEYEVAVLVGGGNFYRGSFNKNIDRSISDSIGMTATIMNSLMLFGMLKNAEIMSAIEIKGLIPEFSQKKAVEILENKKILILACGSGLPFFSTDTAAAIRAGQINADIVLKATKVDGVYSKDPKIFDDAVRFDNISYKEVIEKKLKVMDISSMFLLNDLKIPLYVFSIYNNIKDIFLKNCPFTIVTSDV